VSSERLLSLRHRYIAELILAIAPVAESRPNLLPTATLLFIGRRLDAGTTGSIFGGRRSVLGVTAEAFQDEDRINSALVR
jgi:hypothetical protein